MPNGEWPMTSGVVPHWAGRPMKRQYKRWEPEERIRLARMWNEKAPIELLCDEFGCNPSQIHSKAHQMGLPRRIAPIGSKRRGRPPKKGPKKHGGSQRRFSGVVESTGPKIVLAEHDPRSRAGITVFPTTVIPASKLPRLLKSGVNSRKIGKIVEKGPWKGSPIFTLTLEERATCPRSCLQWANCYGNNMHFAQRISDDGTLERRLWGELAALAAEHPNGFLVRLHVLGDFFSEGYVAFWRSALEEFPQLRIFGFTARIPPQDPIGIRVAEMVRDFYDRCRIRFSGLRFEEDCSVVVDKAEDAIGILCPAEKDPERCCASCGLCWHSNRTISFMKH